MVNEEVRKIFGEYVKSEQVKMHCNEVETIMTFLAKEFGEDEETWGIAGLMHDADCDLTPDISVQGKKASEIAKEKLNCSEEICHAILSHNEENLGVKRESKLDYALSAADNVSGLIYAYALMRNKDISTMDVAGLKKKFKNKGFAATVRRELIQDIEKTGIDLDKFFDIAISAMKSIKSYIGLV